jgi:hypothetical protein
MAAVLAIGLASTDCPNSLSCRQHVDRCRVAASRLPTVLAGVALGGDERPVLSSKLWRGMGLGQAVRRTPGRTPARRLPNPVLRRVEVGKRPVIGSSSPRRTTPRPASAPEGNAELLTASEHR